MSNSPHGNSICRDITDRELLANDRLLTCLDWEETFDTIPDAITIHDASHVIVRANRMARDLFGIPLESNVKARCHFHYHGAQCPPETCLVREAMSKKGPVRAEFYADHLGKHFECNVLPRFDAADKFTGSIHLMRDVTERKKLEEQLFQSQKMESIGTFAGGVAHDFNNILTVIMSTSALMQMKMEEDNPFREGIGQVLEAAERAASLARSLLTFSRKPHVITRPVDVVAIIRTMESFFRRVIGEDIEFVISCPDLELNVLVDPIQLEQVFMNLTVNAKDAMPDGGTLAIDVATVAVDGQMAEIVGAAPGTYAGITFTDSGCGMDGRTRERIFDPFFTTKEVGKGTGLGLSIVYGVINKHGGFIRTYSEVEKGTTFRIYLPLTGGGPAVLGDEEVGICRCSKDVATP